MKKLSFPEKNRALQQLKNEVYFDVDRVLFKKVCPQSRLINELGRANRFTKASIGGRMISEMLNVISVEEIIANRESKEVVEKRIVTNQQVLVKHTEDDVRILLGEMYSEENSNLLKGAYENYKLQVRISLGLPKSLPIWYNEKFINSKKFNKLIPPISNKKKE